MSSALVKRHVGTRGGYHPVDHAARCGTGRSRSCRPAAGECRQRSGVGDARQYNTRSGRFLTPDPITNPYDPATQNRYTYAGNNPATNTDPTGLRTCSDKEDCAGDQTNGNPGYGQGSTPGSSSMPPGGDSDGSLWLTYTDPDGMLTPRGDHDDFGQARRDERLSRNVVSKYHDFVVLACLLDDLACVLWKHYLDGDGRPVEIDAKALRDRYPFSAELDEEMARLQGKAVDMCLNARAKSCTVQVDSQWTPMNWGRGNDLGLKFGIGGMSFRVSGTVEVRVDARGAHVSYSYDVDVYKDWNFDVGDRPAGIDVGDFARMPRFGLAREFPMYGSFVESGFDDYPVR